MSWIRRYRLRLYINSSIWILPAVGMIAGLIAVEALSRLEQSLGWRMSLSPETGRAVMTAIASSMFSLVVLGSSAILVTVQLAGSQITPRIISLVYRLNTRKLALAVFVLTFTFSVGVLARIDDKVPLLTGYLAAYGFLLNLVLFIYFIDRIGKTLRPSAVLQYVALTGREVIHSVYPRSFDDRAAITKPPFVPIEKPTRTILNDEDGVVIAFDLNGLVAQATRSNCFIEMMPAVGDYIAAGDPLFRVFEGGGQIAEDDLRGSIAVGSERTMEQDPMFAFRIIVDVATKALSPAVNDPTTAVLAIDQLHHLLRDVGNRFLAESYEKDPAGKVRVVYRTPNWEDFVHLAITEVRQYGSNSIQVMRRLRAMLENLIGTLPAHRTPVLRRELLILERSARRSFPEVNDQELAEASDSQGMGAGDESPYNSAESTYPSTPSAPVNA